MRLAPFVPAMPQITSPSDSNPLLIGFLGQAAVGKTSLAAWCKDTYGGEILSFAAPVKMEVFEGLRKLGAAGHNSWAIPNGLQEAEVFNDLPTPTEADDPIAWMSAHKGELRSLIQYFGTEFRRSQDPLYWIDKLMPQIEALRSNGVNAIYVDDVRFREEAIALSDVGFSLVRISCDSKVQIERATQRDSSFNPQTLEHKSETDLLYFPADYALDNSVELHLATDALKKAILSILNR